MAVFAPIVLNAISSQADTRPLSNVSSDAQSLLRRLALALFILCTIVASSPIGTVAQAKQSILNTTPLVFEPNRGQAPSAYQFLARRNGMEALYFSNGMDLFVPQSPSTIARLRIRWTGTNAKASISGEGILTGHSNYLRGSDPTRWFWGIPQFSRVRYTRIYAGVDLVFHGNGDDLEHDFVIEPGASPSQITFHINQPLRLTRSGDLEVDLGTSIVRFQKPSAYQDFGANRKNVRAEFVLAGNGRVKFRVGEYDRNRPLVVDPVFGFSSYLAGIGTDLIEAVTSDPIGNVYVTGFTNSPDFPIANATCSACTAFLQTGNAYVSKLDPTGHTLLYSTYIGATGGAIGYSIVVDKNANILVAGLAGSSNFPQAGAVQSPSCQGNHNCFFVLSLKPDGSALNYAGVIGGAAGSFTNGKNAILAVDSAGNAYLTGVTDDPQFQLTPGVLGPTLPGYPYDSPFVLKVDPTGKLIYSTVIPGTAPLIPFTPGTNNFPASGISVDANGQVTLAGTAGIGLPTTPGVLQGIFPPNNTSSGSSGAGYVLQLNATATALNYATYIVGTDYVGGLAVDSRGDSYITGRTSELDLPVTANAYQKTIVPTQNCTCNAGFVLKLDGQGKSVLAATYLSGTTSFGNEGTTFTGIALDSRSNVFVGGMTGSTNFPLQNPILSTLQFSVSVFGLVLAEMNPDLSSLLFGSFLSATDTLGGSQFTGLAIDFQDNLIVTGETLSKEFPTTQNSFQPILPASPNPLVTENHGFISKLNMATTAPSVCLNPLSVNFGSILVNTSTSQTLNVTNCGNAPLQLSTVTSSLTTVTAMQSCGAIAPGSSCGVQLTFTPIDTSTSSGSITLTDNAAIPHQTVSFIGAGGLPRVLFPRAISASDLLVGTQAEFFISFINRGTGNWIVSNVTTTGDFSVDNRCTAPLPPFTIRPPGVRHSCAIGFIFGPSQPGLRTGTLTITDNAAGSPHVIQLSGNGLVMYPTPSIAAILAVPTDRQSQGLQISGANFFPTSQVVLNGTPRTTHYIDQQELTADLLLADLAQVGELPVTVSNPSPGGGASNIYIVTIYAAIRNLGILHNVYEPKSGLLYASISTQSTNYANQIAVIDPAAASVLHAWSVGNGPNQLAISDDGQYLYVGLDGDKKVAQIALPSGTVNFAIGLGTDPDFHNPMVADAIRVLPGQPHAWAVTLCGVGFGPCGEGIAVFDDAVQRPTFVAQNQLQPDSLVFVGNDATTLFGTTLQQLPSTFYKFGINSNGITKNQEVTNFASTSPGGGTLDTDGTSIYVSNGQVIDPATLTLKSGFKPIPSPAGLKVDVARSRAYFAGATDFQPPSNSDYVIDAFDLASQQLLGAIPMVESVGVPEVFRWGKNGLALSTQPALLLLRTDLTGNSALPPQFTVSGLSPSTAVAGIGDLMLTISGNGFALGDLLTVNGAALPLTIVSGNLIATSIPASLLSAAGNIELTITDPADRTTNLVLVVYKTVRALVEAVLNEMEGLLNQLHGHERKNLGEAIENLSSSLDTSMWKPDGNHLSHDHGQRVYAREEGTVEELLEMIDRSSIPTTKLQEFVAKLLQADRTLSAVAIRDAAARGGESEGIAEANEELAEGDAAAAAGKANRAIDEFKATWMKVAQADMDNDEHESDRHDRHHNSEHEILQLPRRGSE
jgi:hypothetical protein